MAGFPARSTSMPSRLHPLPPGIEEELRKLKSHVPSSSSSATAMHGTLEGLANLYGLIGDLLSLPLGRKAVSHLRKGSFVEEMLEGYVRLLDACNAMRDALLLAKQGAREVQSALRRRGGAEVAVADQVDAYLRLRKKMKRDVDKSLRSLKFKECARSHLALDMDANVSTIVRAIGEANNASISTLSSFLLFISSQGSIQDVRKKKGKWSSLVNRGILKRAAAEEKIGSEFEAVDAVLYKIHRHHRKGEGDASEDLLEVANKRLESFDVCTGRLEGVVERIFRKIIQNRVTFLNMLSM